VVTDIERIARAVPDGEGGLFISDVFAHRLIHLRDGRPEVLGGPDRYHYPCGLLVRNNHLYVCDSWHHRIQILTRAGEPVSAIDGFVEPRDLAEVAGRLWVLDAGAQELRIYDGELDGAVTTLAAKRADVSLDFSEFAHNILTTRSSLPMHHPREMMADADLVCLTDTRRLFLLDSDARLIETRPLSPHLKALGPDRGVFWFYDARSGGLVTYVPLQGLSPSAQTLENVRNGAVLVDGTLFERDLRGRTLDRVTDDRGWRNLLAEAQGNALLIEPLRNLLAELAQVLTSVGEEAEILLKPTLVPFEKPIWSELFRDLPHYPVDRHLPENALKHGVRPLFARFRDLSELLGNLLALAHRLQAPTVWETVAGACLRIWEQVRNTVASMAAEDPNLLGKDARVFLGRGLLSLLGGALRAPDHPLPDSWRRICDDHAALPDTAFARIAQAVAGGGHADALTALRATHADRIALARVQMAGGCRRERLVLLHRLSISRWYDAETRLTAAVRIHPTLTRAAYAYSLVGSAVDDLRADCLGQIEDPNTLARHAMATGDHAAARHQAARQDDTDPRKYNTLAQIEAEGGNLAAALRISAAMKEAPDFSLMRGTLYEVTGHYAEALADYRVLKDQGRKIPMLDLQIFAMTLCTGGDTAGILEASRLAEGGKALARATALWLSGDLEGASAALKDQPKPELWRLTQGLLHRARGETEAALAWIDREQAVYPRNATLLERYLTTRDRTDREALAAYTHLYWQGRKHFRDDPLFEEAIDGYLAVERGRDGDAVWRWRCQYYLEQARFSICL